MPGNVSQAAEHSDEDDDFVTPESNLGKLSLHIKGLMWKMEKVELGNEILQQQKKGIEKRR